MLEYGQPMHAFDFSCVKGGEIHVRCAREGESIQTLDGTERKLNPSMLCICDTEKPVGVAGVMGGANSEIVGDTAMVLFESANFNGTSIRRTATALGMRTDASSRYEKGLDPQNTYAAVQRACELIELLGAGEVLEGVIDVCPNELKQTTVKLEPEKVNALLGTDLSEQTMRDILLRLGLLLGNGARRNKNAVSRDIGGDQNAVGIVNTASVCTHSALGGHLLDDLGLIGVILHCLNPQNADQQEHDGTGHDHADHARPSQHTQMYHGFLQAW
jgi:hypothetical protein